MKKYKATWKLYSSRRKITLESLIRREKLSGYESYVTYCESMSIEPISYQDFQSQTAQLFVNSTADAVKQLPVPSAKPDSIPPSEDAYSPAQTAVEVPDTAKGKKKYNKWEKSASQEASVTDETKKED